MICIRRITSNHDTRPILKRVSALVYLKFFPLIFFVVDQFTKHQQKCTTLLQTQTVSALVFLPCKATIYRLLRICVTITPGHKAVFQMTYVPDMYPPPHMYQGTRQCFK
jgi:hypothetical protein